MVEALTHTQFQQRVGEDFVCSLPGQLLLLRLDETRQLGPALRDGGAFALYFGGPLAPMLPQATYSFNHPMLGSLDLFIVPVARTDEGMRYEALFT